MTALTLALAAAVVAVWAVWLLMRQAYRAGWRAADAEQAEAMRPPAAVTVEAQLVAAAQRLRYLESEHVQ